MVKFRGLLIALFTTLLLVNESMAQSQEVQYLIDTSIKIMKNNAVHRDKVDWTIIKEEAHKKALNLSSPYQMGPVMRYIFESIHDFHGSFFYKDSNFQWHGNSRKISNDIMQEWKKGPHIKTMILKGEMAYLRIPSILGGSVGEWSQKAQELNDSFCVVLGKNVKGVILDLRLDGGGAMFPMILGVEQLLGEGKLGSFLTKKTENWYIRQNKFFVDTSVLSVIIPKCVVDGRNLPVVLLIGTGTGSSGEFLTMAFEGRKNTLFLGTKTAGFVTVNTGFPINDTAFLNLAIGWGTDRNGRVYNKAIDPDVLMDAPDQFNDVANDEKVLAAESWLKKHAKRQRP